MIVGQHGQALGTEEVVVPQPQQAQEHRQVLLERRRAEMDIHGMKASQHFAEVHGPTAIISDRPIAESML